MARRALPPLLVRSLTPPLLHRSVPCFVPRSRGAPDRPLALAYRSPCCWARSATDNLAGDLYHFSRHAKRQVITNEDVKLAARRSPSIKRALEEFEQANSGVARRPSSEGKDNARGREDSPVRRKRPAEGSPPRKARAGGQGKAPARKPGDADSESEARESDQESDQESDRAGAHRPRRRLSGGLGDEEDPEEEKDEEDDEMLRRGRFEEESD
jgi:hypothetical protein